MNFGELKAKTLKELKGVCKNNRFFYKGYSLHTRKADLITFIICKNTNRRSEPTPEVISDLTELFETPEDIEERYTEMYMERPHDSEIQDLVSSLQTTYSKSNVIFDNHDDPNNDMIYKANKGKYISQYNSLGENGEMILYHGTNGDNLTGILSDDFRLTSNAVHGSLFGRGIYFTNDIQKAIFYSERGKTTKYVIVCVVHIGDIVKGNHTMNIHPKMPNSDKQFDTSVDDIRDPKQFIKKKNGTYNILGILTIENYIAAPMFSNSLQNRGFSGSFSIKNTGPRDIVLYWIPDKYASVLHTSNRRNRAINLNLCKRLTMVKGGRRSGNQLCNIGHTFICVDLKRGSAAHWSNNVCRGKDIVRVFKSKQVNETIYVS